MIRIYDGYVPYVVYDIRVAYFEVSYCFDDCTTVRAYRSCLQCREQLGEVLGLRLGSISKRRDWHLGTGMISIYGHHTLRYVTNFLFHSEA